MKLVIRPIRYTSDVEAVRTWAGRLGMAPLLESPGWYVFGADRGRLAIHEVPAGDALDGSTTLAFETDDLDALEQRWQQAGLVTRRIDDYGIPLLFAETPFGGEIAAGELSPDDGAARESDLVLMPMLVADDVPAAADWFASWGLRRRISSEGGGWTDMEVEGEGGILAIHGRGDLSSTPPPEAPADASSGVRELAVSLNFEHPDVDDLCERLLAAGLDDARVHDEAYNRTLIVTSPDGDQVWVNGVMADLYGYRRD